MNNKKSKATISTIFSVLAAVITIIGTVSYLIANPTSVTGATYFKVFVSMFTPSKIILSIYWICFSAIYIICILHEKYHKIDLGEETLVAKNYPLTLWVWGIIVICFYYMHTYKSFGIPKDPDNIYYLSNWFTFIPSGYVESIFIAIGIILLSVGLVFVALGRVQLNGQWKTDIYRFENHKIYTDGVYSTVRHPIYNGQNYMAIGTLFILDTMAAMIFPIAVICYNYLRSLREEAELKKMNDLDYEGYVRNVHRSMFWPL